MSDPGNPIRPGPGAHALATNEAANGSTFSPRPLSTLCTCSTSTFSTFSTLATLIDRSRFVIHLLSCHASW